MSSKAPLTQDDVQSYWDDGYLFPIRVFSEAEAQSFRTDLETVETDWSKAHLRFPMLQYKRSMRIV